MARLILKPGRERPLLQRHPWVFSGAVARVEGNPEPGATLPVVSGDGEFLGVAGWNPASQLCARIWTFADEPVDAAFFRRRLAAALALRRLEGLAPAATLAGSRAAFRLVHAEADGLPGLIADVYAGFIVLQVLTLAVEKNLPVILDTLAELLSPEGIYERSDVDLRTREGLEERTGVLRGVEPPDRVEIAEGGLRLLVDLKRGQKTGFFLDQRDNRRIVADYAERLAMQRQAEGRPSSLEILNAFSYTGGFGLAAARACPGARVVHLDASAEALALARDMAELNGLDPAGMEFLVGNAFELLRKFRDQARQFDLIVLDPPKFAASQAAVDKAARGYKDLALLGFKLLRPGGLMATFSCSGAVSPELFQKIIAGAAVDARCETQILHRLGPGPDHPLLPAFAEGEYLKGLLLRRE